MDKDKEDDSEDELGQPQISRSFISMEDELHELRPLQSTVRKCQLQRVGSHNSDHSDDESIFEAGRSRDSNVTCTPDGLRRRSISMSSKTGSEKSPDFTVQRPVLTVTQKHQQYRYSRPVNKGFHKSLQDKVRKETRCSAKRLKQTLFLRLPIIKWLLHYNLKKDLVGDLISGITVAVMHIPQGMAYAMLAGLAPISGIYMAFFPVLVYAFLASSRHCSMGTFAVVCLMTGKVVSDYATFPPEVSEQFNETESSIHNDTTIYSPTEVSTIVCFGVSIWMLLFGFLNIGSLSVFLSDMLVSGFTTGAAVHVFTSQLKSLFGVSVKTYNGTFKIIMTWKAILGQILRSNPATMVVSMICIIILTFNNEIIKPRLRKVTKIPIPIELAVVVGGTLASRYGSLNENYDVLVVGNIPTGLPLPKLPPFNLLGKVIIPSLTIAVVSYSVSISVAKIFATRMEYTVDATQELYATGLGNLVGSFFRCAPVSASLARSLIQVSVGGVTQLASFISCSIIILVLLFIGPFFETLPNCVLASIIVTALKGMFLQVYDFTRMWKISKREASVWLISFLAVVIIDIDYGLFIGIGCTLLQLIYSSQIPTVTVLGRVPHTDIYLDKDRYASVIEIPGVKMCHVAGTLHFANRESFLSSLIGASRIDPKVIIKRDKKAMKKLQMMEASSKNSCQETQTKICAGNGPVSSVEETATELRRESFCANIPQVDEGDVTKINDKFINELEKNFLSLALPDTKWLIVDFSGVGKMDVSGARNLNLVFKEFTDAHITVCYASLSETCLEVMETCGALKDLPEDIFFHSVHDAVSYATGLSPQGERTPESVNHL